MMILAAVALMVGCGNETNTKPASSPEPQANNFNQPENQPKNDIGAKPTNQPSTLATPPSQPSTFNDPKPQQPMGQDKALAKTDKPLTDGEVLNVLIAANEGEVAMADAAMKKSSNADVKQFAGMMKTHHTQGGQKAKAFGTKAKIAPADSDVSGYLKTEVDDAMKDMKDKDGKSFDKAYVDVQVKAHKDVLSAIDNRLAPSVQNGELKAMVTDTRKVVADHLSKAEDLQKKMDNRSSMNDVKRF